MTPANLPAALAEWRDAVGPHNVVVAPDELLAAETATFATTQRVPAIVRPADRAQVQECVRIAVRHQTPIYPISSGMNWGYGSRVPSSSAVLLDLGRMNRIVDFSEEHGYIVVEPGVTQEQAFQFLRERGSKLWLDATGASPRTSLIGNTLERGFGHTPYGDHWGNVCALEAVLPDGSAIETGYSRFANAKAANVYRWGLGPVLDGLFTQSNLGIVTRLTVWLMPAPEYFQAYFFSVESAETLGPLVDALRPLRLARVIPSAVHIGNDYKVVSSMMQYPWEDAGGVTPLPESVLASYRKKLNIGVWNGSGGLYGTRNQVAECRRLIKAALRPVTTKLEFLDENKLALARRFSGVYKLFTGWDITRALDVAQPVFDLMQGRPTGETLASSYWRKRTPPPKDPNPDRDRCGLIWCSPVGPISGSHAQRVASIASKTLLEAGFEPHLSITLLTERAFACVISLIYDRDQPGQDEQAHDCYRQLLGVLTQEGYYSYRLSINGYSQVSGASTNYQQLIETLRLRLDPTGIVGKGRYSL